MIRSLHHLTSIVLEFSCYYRKSVDSWRSNSARYIIECYWDNTFITIKRKNSTFVKPCLYFWTGSRVLTIQSIGHNYLGWLRFVTKWVAPHKGSSPPLWVFPFKRNKFQVYTQTVIPSPSTYHCFYLGESVYRKGSGLCEKQTIVQYPVLFTFSRKSRILQ